MVLYCVNCVWICQERGGKVEKKIEVGKPKTTPQPLSSRENFAIGSILAAITQAIQAVAVGRLA